MINLSLFCISWICCTDTTRSLEVHSRTAVTCQTWQSKHLNENQMFAKFPTNRTYVCVCLVVSNTNKNKPLHSSTHILCAEKPANVRNSTHTRTPKSRSHGGGCGGLSHKTHTRTHTQTPKRSRKSRTRPHRSASKAALKLLPCTRSNEVARRVAAGSRWLGGAQCSASCACRVLLLLRCCGFALIWSQNVYE